jgi:hypothetical protein
MSYSAKFASCFYGPFREAAASGPSFLFFAEIVWFFFEIFRLFPSSPGMTFGDRSKYQLPPMGRDLGSLSGCLLGHSLARCFSHSDPWFSPFRCISYSCDEARSGRGCRHDHGETWRFVRSFSHWSFSQTHKLIPSAVNRSSGPYLDLVRDAKNLANVPIAIYHVSVCIFFSVLFSLGHSLLAANLTPFSCFVCLSLCQGEYAMLYHAAQAGSFKLEEAVMEAVRGFRRAGATIIITYFADLILDQLESKKYQPVIRSKL